MKSFLPAVLCLVGMLGYVVAVNQCYICKHGWEEPDVCNATSDTEYCNGNQFICSIRVKNDKGELLERRECSNENSCNNNMDKNADSCQNGTVPEGQSCYYCCDEDLCNYDRLDYFAGVGSGAAHVVMTSLSLLILFAGYQSL